MPSKIPMDKRMAEFIELLRKEVKADTLKINELKKIASVTDPFNSGKTLCEFGFLKKDKAKKCGFSWAWLGNVHMRDVRNYVELVREKGRDYYRDRNYSTKKPKKAPKAAKETPPEPQPIQAPEPVAPAVNMVALDDLNTLFDRLNTNVLKSIAKQERLEKTITAKNRELTVAMSDMSKAANRLSETMDSVALLVETFQSVLTAAIRGVNGIDPKNKVGASRGIVCGID